MTAQEVKDFCKENGLTYKELAQKLGWSEPSLRATIANGKISEQTAASINLLKENIRIKRELQNWETIKAILKNI